MKLKHIPENEKLIKQSLKIKESASIEIDEYTSYVQENTGQKISREDVIVSMIRTFLEDDKKFQSWKKGRANGHQKDSILTQESHQLQPSL
ncbi:MAG: DUF2274 domain-containing protein [Methyloprofundus sp.]|nr:DUF2274 domain-containing protein [Methyloprofundus sp.]